MSIQSANDLAEALLVAFQRNAGEGLVLGPATSAVIDGEFNLMDVAADLLGEASLFLGTPQKPGA